MTTTTPQRSNHSSSARVLTKLLVLCFFCILIVHLESGWFQQQASTFSLDRITSLPQLRVQQQQTSSPLDDDYDVCIVGAGLSGAVIAERYATMLQQKVLVMEKRNHIGGNCYDYIDNETNIRVSKYGAHLFHTFHRRVWDYIHRFSHWTPYEHRVLGLVEGKHVPIPVNIDTVNALFDLSIENSKEMDAWLQKEQVKYTENPKNSEEMALSRVGPRLYAWIFKPYTFKQWARYPAELGPEVTARIPVRNNWDDRYFGDPYQALPTKGYTAFFERLLDSRYITVVTNTDFFSVRPRLKCGRLYYTGPIDTYFADLGWPKLEYRSLDFERVVKKNVDYFQPASVVNHPQMNDNYTRIVEYKHLLNQSSPDTIYFIERSNDDGEPYYPIPNEKNQALYRKYQDLAVRESNVTFVGRLANYKYFNMDQAILNALQLFDRDTGISEDAQWTDLLAPIVENESTKKEPTIKVAEPAKKDNKTAATTATTTPAEKKNQTAATETPLTGSKNTTDERKEPSTVKRKMQSTLTSPKKTHWCIIDKTYAMKIDPEWFSHFPHASEAILPCWSWFRRHNATDNCGFVLMDGLRLDKPNPNSWQQQLVTAMGCKVQYLDSALSREGYPLPSEEIQYVPNLQLLRPRYNQRIYVEKPEDAHALRRLLVNDTLIENKKGDDKPLQIGMVQRTRSRVITNIDDIQAALQKALPDAVITQSDLEGFTLHQQAEFFATKNIIIAAHGAGLTNCLFITPGTIVLQIYPQNYFLQSLDPLTEQVGGIAMDWFYGSSPIRDWIFHKSVGLQRWYRESSIAPPPEEIVQKLLGALGKRRVSRDEVVVW